MKVSDLEGDELNRYCALAQGWRRNIHRMHGECADYWSGGCPVDVADYDPVNNWAQMGPIIEDYGIWLSDDATDEPSGPHIASVGGAHMQYGSTPLIAAGRAFVTSVYGDSVDA